MSAEVVWPWLGPKMPADPLEYCESYMPNQAWVNGRRPVCGYQRHHDGLCGWWDGNTWEEWERKA